MKRNRFCFFTIFIFVSPLISRSRTEFGEGSGRYGILLNDLKKNLYEKSPVKTVSPDGEERRMFTLWVRDHIHTLKTCKYWEKDLASYIDFLMGRQTEPWIPAFSCIYLSLYLI
jgi:hypothetical protein